MPAFPNTTTLSTANLDATTDSPADARSDLKDTVDAVQEIIDSYDSASGIAALTSSGVLSNTKLPDTIVSSSGNNLVLDPNTSMVKIQDFVNINPVAHASLPASPVKGDVAFLTTDSLAAAQNRLVYYDGSGWKYVADDAAVN